MSGTELEVPQTMDANPPPDTSPVEGVRTPRDDIMARIAANAEAARERELAQSQIYDTDAREAGLSYPADEPEEQPEPPASAPVAQPAPQRPPAHQATPAPVASPAPRTILIEGQHYTVTPEQEDQLIRLGMATNVALRQYQDQPVVPPAQEPPRQIIDPEAIREAVKKIQYGGEDDAAAALTDLISGVVSRVPVAQPVDQNAIISRATQEWRAQQQLLADATVIRDEYQDIFAHPQREFLAKVNVDAIRARDAALGQRRADLDVYREAGDMVREAMNLPRPGNQTNDPAFQAAPGNVVSMRNDVIERKRAAPRATQAIGLRAPAPAAPRPLTGSDIVDQYRKQRGQVSIR